MSEEKQGVKDPGEVDVVFTSQGEVDWDFYPNSYDRQGLNLINRASPTEKLADVDYLFRTLRKYLDEVRVLESKLEKQSLNCEDTAKRERQQIRKSDFEQRLIPFIVDALIKQHKLDYSEIVLRVGRMRS